VTPRWLVTGGALAVLTVAATFPAGSARAAATAATAATPGAASTSTPAPLRLLSQTSWVTPGTPFEMAVAVDVAAPADDVLVYVDVYRALGSRSEFARSLVPGWSGPSLAHPVRGVPLSAFASSSTGSITIELPTGTLANQLHVTGPSVYPIAVTLRHRGVQAPIATLMTHLVATPAGAEHRLDVALVVPVHAPPPNASVPGAPLAPDQAAKVAGTIGVLAAHPKVPLSIQATPDTVAALMATDAGSVNRLGQALGGRELLASTWVPTSVPAMLAAGLSQEVSLSLTRGDDALTGDVGTPATTRTWVQSGPVDQATLAFLRLAQFDRVVLPEADLGPNPDPQGKTIVRPFEVEADQTLVRAAVADGGLAAHLTAQPDPVLAAHQLLADLAQIYGDAPNETQPRGVVVVPPPSWSPDPAFLNALLTGLQSSPLVAPATVDAFFDSVPTALTTSGAPLTRSIVTDPATVRAASVALLPDGQRAARADLKAIAALVPQSDTAVYPPLERTLLEVPSSDLTPATRALALDALSRGVQEVLSQVQLPSTRTITLTARTGHLPLSVVSLSDQPLQVLLQVESDKLKFPGAGTANTATFPLTLHKGTNTIADLTVEARTSGAFPLHLTVMTPDGGVVIARTTVTVQSTALSGVGVVLSVGAALFLVLWWSRHAWKARRAAQAEERHRQARGRADGPTGVAPAGRGVPAPS
jgi:hypothetical protein